MPSAHQKHRRRVDIANIAHVSRRWTKRQNAPSGTAKNVAFAIIWRANPVRRKKRKLEMNPKQRRRTIETNKSLFIRTTCGSHRANAICTKKDKNQTKDSINNTRDNCRVIDENNNMTNYRNVLQVSLDGPKFAKKKIEHEK